MLLCCAPLIACSLSNSSPVARPVTAAALQGETEWWQPQADDQLRWYWQLQDAIDTSKDVDVYDIDIDTPKSVITQLKGRGVKLICYFSVGTVELFRPDAALFPPQIQGQHYVGYEDEKWLDISNYPVFADVILARLDRCAAKGFDGVEGDNVDAFLQREGVGAGTGFDITRQHTIDYINWLADESHRRGLGFGLKNAEALAEAVIDKVDWMITENCYVYHWCGEAAIFTEANKPVFMTEYVEYLEDFDEACKRARKLGYSAIYRDTGLTARGRFLECL